MKPRNVNVSLIEVGGQLQVWGVSFALNTPPGLLSLPSGPEREAARKKLEKAIARAIAETDITLGT